jgi:response regulator RpfG family c-di-GMP phosphodiesterase
LPANLRITGLRGVGKSVLLKRLEELATAGGWLTSRLQLEPRHNREDALAELESCAGSQFDPQIARAFLTI